MYQFPCFAIIFVISSILCFISAAMLWRRLENPGSIPFALLLLSLTIWSFASIFEAGATTVNGKIFWSKWQYIGITAIAPFWLHFVADYTQSLKRKSWFFRFGIWVIPLGTLVLAATNDYHQLIWSNVTVMDDMYYIAHYEHGIGYFIHLLYSYIILLLGTVWLIRDFFHGEKTRQNQLIIFLVVFGLYLVRFLKHRCCYTTE